MAELRFVGAAGSVTGSKHLVVTESATFLVDAGLYQGTRALQARNLEPLPVPAGRLDAVVVTHGHLDHCGYLPRLFHDGFRGRIHCTPPTAGVVEIVLEDAARLQERARRRGFHDRVLLSAPFYEDADVRGALEHLDPVALETPFTIGDATLRLHNAGHIIGSAFVEAEIAGRRTVFSGDVGRYGGTLLDDPAPLGAPDAIVCETTYGDRVHAPNAVATLERTLVDALRRGGPIVIPAFAVQRTQALLLAIGELQKRNDALARVPVHLDSPMAIEVDALFARFPRDHKPFDRSFGIRDLRLHVTSDDSKRLNALDTAEIVVASSGMATGGRVLFHLHRLLPDARATIVFVGFQVPGTMGRALVDGATRVRVFGDTLRVEAAIAAVPGFSAHADRGELLRWLGTATTKPRFYAVHGEPAAAAAFAALVEERLGFPASVGERGATVAI